MKTFRVLVTAYRVVMVKAANAEDAEAFVFNDCPDATDWTIDRAEVDGILKTAGEIARCTAHGGVMLK